MTLGERIKAARKEKGITQKELADLINKGFSTVQKYEIDVIEPPISVLEKIAKALEIDPMTLIYGNTLEVMQSIDTVKKAIERNQRIFEKKPTEEDMKFIIKCNEKNKLKQDTISKYDSLNALGQKKANEYITDLSEQEKYTIPDEEENPR